MDRERIIIILSDIKKYRKDLDDRNIKNIQDLENLEKYYAASMILFSLLNRVIDIAQEIVISKKYGMPASYKDTFRILSQRKFIEKDMLIELEKFVDLRNSLSHEYYKLEASAIFHAVNNIKSIDQFVDIVCDKIK